MSRYPISNEVLARAAAVWYNAEPGDHEADAAFEAVLLEQGVISSDETVSFMCRLSMGFRGAICVAPEGDDAFCIDVRTGAVL